MSKKKILYALIIVFSLFSLVFAFPKHTFAQTCNTGDGNGDGLVDGFDYVIWWQNFNKNVQGAQNGDFDCNGYVDGFDYVIWWQNFGTQVGTPTPTPAISPPPTELRAFPGAEGFGARSVGGRGGKVIEVTNLNDSGTGSLRACIDALGPRTCVFRVAGTINVASQTNIKNPYITIAGQTAPGGGITLRTTTSNNSSEGPIVIRTHNVIIRHIRSRPGPGKTTSSCCLSAIRMLGGSDIILDHVSVSWAVDENLSNWFAQSDITVQWSIVSESLHRSTHQEGAHGKGYLVGDASQRVSVHHNLFAHNNDRNPNVKPDTSVEFINNLVYNWEKPSNGATYFGGSAAGSSDLIKANAIGNHYIPGPNTPAGTNNKGIAIGLYDPISTSSRLYVKDNIGPGRLTNTGDNWLVVNGNTSYRSLSSVVSSGNVTIDPVEFIKDPILNGAGATLGLDDLGRFYQRRDSVDSRIISEVELLTGRIINHPSEVGGWPTLAPGTPYTDDDLDGMADQWEIIHFGTTSRGSQGDSSSDFDRDGYTDLEEFLNRTNPKQKNTI